MQETRLVRIRVARQAEEMARVNHCRTSSSERNLMARWLRNQLKQNPKTPERVESNKLHIGTLTFPQDYIWTLIGLSLPQNWETLSYDNSCFDGWRASSLVEFLACGSSRIIFILSGRQQKVSDVFYFLKQAIQRNLSS